MWNHRLDCGCFFFRPRASVLPAETTDFRLNHASFGRELHFGRRGFQPLVFFEPTLRVMIFDVFIGGKTCHDGLFFFENVPDIGSMGLECVLSIQFIIKNQTNVGKICYTCIIWAQEGALSLLFEEFFESKIRHEFWSLQPKHLDMLINVISVESKPVKSPAKTLGKRLCVSNTRSINVIRAIYHKSLLL